jgi:hypothetical protein
MHQDRLLLLLVLLLALLLLLLLHLLDLVLLVRVLELAWGGCRTVDMLLVDIFMQQLLQQEAHCHLRTQ